MREVRQIKRKFISVLNVILQMVAGVILIVLGIISILVSLIISDKLFEDKYYLEEWDSGSIFMGGGRMAFLRFFHALISPWAYFKPQKVREGWEMLVLSSCCFVLGVVLIVWGIGKI